jgi:hypothetical protein
MVAFSARSQYQQYPREPEPERPVGKIRKIYRFIPAVTVAPEHGALDITPQIGYRLTNMLTVGVGWNERVGFRFHHHFHFSGRRNVYGPRVYMEFRWRHGIFWRGEVEQMNAYLPPILGVSPPGSSGQREWVLGIFAGIKKTFRLSSRCIPNIQLLYNLYHAQNERSPYPSPFNFRVGVDFRLGPQTH